MSKTYKVGAVVRVGKAYVGAGQYQANGSEGLYTVVGVLPPGDYYLARGDISHDPQKAFWDVIMHETRITAARRTRS